MKKQVVAKFPTVCIYKLCAMSTGQMHFRGKALCTFPASLPKNLLPEPFGIILNRLQTARASEKDPGLMTILVGFWYSLGQSQKVVEK